MATNHNTNKDKSRSTFRVLMLVGMGALCGGVPTYFCTVYQAEKQFELSKYKLMTELQCRTAELFDEAVYSAEMLIAKYGVVAVQEANIPSDEMETFNSTLKDINIQLSKLYLIMPDKFYANIIPAVSGISKLKELKRKVLIEMRKSQFPETSYIKEDDIRFLNYIKEK